MLGLGLGKKIYIIGLWSNQSSRIDAAMRVLLLYFLKTLLYLIDYFNTYF